MHTSVDVWSGKIIEIQPFIKWSMCSIMTSVEMLKAWIYIEHKAVWQMD